MSRQAFIEQVAPVAMELWLEGSVIFPSVRTAQAILETGGVVPYWNSLTGYKVGSGTLTPYWTGAYVNKQTREVIQGVVYDQVYANFRAYDSFENSLRDQDMLFASTRYATVRTAQTPQEQAKALYKSGYATDAPREVDGDPSYDEKLVQIINSYSLMQFDEEAKQMLSELQAELQLLKEQNQQLSERLAIVESKETMSEIPEWAAEAVDKAVSLGVVGEPAGSSYDFFRILTVLERLHLLNQKVI